MICEKNRQSTEVAKKMKHDMHVCSSLESYYIKIE